MSNSELLYGGKLCGDYVFRGEISPISERMLAQSLLDCEQL